MDSSDAVYEALRLRQRAIFQEAEGRGHMEDISELDRDHATAAAIGAAAAAAAAGQHTDDIDYEQ